MPAILLVVDIARVLGWRVERTRRWLSGMGLLEKRGRKYVTTPEKLASGFPEVMHKLSELDEE